MMFGMSECERTIYRLRPKDNLNRERIDRLMDVKRKTLGYQGASIRHSSGISRSLESAGYSAVKTQEDANKLIDALCSDGFPKDFFAIEWEEYPETVDILWHMAVE